MKYDPSKIINQVPLWDLYAKIAPLIFLVVTGIFWTFNLLTVTTGLYIAFGLFLVTMVVWWFWTIYTIRFLIMTLLQAQENFKQATEEIKIIKKELERYKSL